MQQKILFIIGTLERGGTERHLSYILPLLKKNNWDVSIITLTNKNSLLPIFVNAQIPVLQPNISFLKFKSKLPKLIGKIVFIIYTILRLSNIFKKDKNAILHFFLPESYILGLTAAVLIQHKSVTVMSRRSMNDYFSKKPLFKWIESKLHKKIFFVLGNSKKVVDQLVFEEKIPSFKAGLIYNGIEDRRELRNPNTDNNIIIITIIANLIYYKGHEDLLKALSNIKNKICKNWILNIVGADPQNRAEVLKKYSIDLKIDKHITWHGEIDNIENIWNTTDIGVLCSHQEGFSNSIIEAMRSKIPMVVTDVGGNAEAIIHNECGLVVEAQNPVALGNAILKLANNSILRNQFGENARTRYLENFSIENCVQKYENVYKSLAVKSYPERENSLEIKRIY
ncbi:glycosyltransferase [Fluviispira multicolorata]|uniref:glycosyltransferase n=1 Tax=Fluviispira multicolorata TaxID=2654512 RepID=UPI0013755EB7|nr:glycosyltransferase [Fluviispira multicolorata]